jgi:flagellar biosynthesis protein FlhA
VPGIPFAPFAALAAGAGVLSRAVPERPKEELPIEPQPAPPAGSEPEDLRGALVLDELELEIGYGLIPLVDTDRGGELLARIRATRRQLATELGFLVPLIHIRDNLQLDPAEYAILVRGNAVASARIPPGRSLALSPGKDAAELPGIATHDPAFGIPAVWIQERDREHAVAAGYAVVDAASALATHLAEVIRGHAAELLTRQQVRELLDAHAEQAPKVVEEIVPSIVSLSILHRTLRSLVDEGVSIRDLGSILETLAEYAPKIEDPDLLTDLVRERLGRTIVRPHIDKEGSLRVLTLEPALEDQLRESVQRSQGGSFLAVEPDRLERLLSGVRAQLEAMPIDADGQPPVLLTSQAVRSPLRQLLARATPRLAVLSHNELPPDVRIVAIGQVEAG